MKKKRKSKLVILAMKNSTLMQMILVTTIMVNTPCVTTAASFTDFINSSIT